MIGQPGHHLGHAGNLGAIGDLWPVDQDDGNAALTGGQQFGVRTAAAGVLGNDQIDGVCMQKVAVARQIKRASADHDGGSWQRQRLVRTIHQPQQVVVLRLTGKAGDMLATDGQKYPPFWLVQSRYCRFDIRHMGPLIAWLRPPCRSLQGDQRDPGLRGGGNGVLAYLSGKRMRCVDQMGDAFGFNVARQPFHAAKSADAHRHRLDSGQRNASGIGQGGRDPRLSHSRSQRRRLAGAAKDQECLHG